MSTQPPQGAPLAGLSPVKALMGESDTRQADLDALPRDFSWGPIIKPLLSVSAPSLTHFAELLKDPEVLRDKAFWKL